MASWVKRSLAAPQPGSIPRYLRLMTWPRWVLVVYAVINIIMGLQAYFFPSDGVAHIMSLAGGVGAGILILFAVYITTINPRGGYIMALCVCALLIMHFGRGVLSDATNPNKGGVKFYPKVLSVGMALLVAGALGYGHLQARAKAKAEAAQEG